MNYKHIYEKIIERGLTRESSEIYLETHHIVPRCLGGNNEPNNLVKLTPEEHYIAHQLLVKIHPNHEGLIYAAMMMTVHSRSNARSNNKMYGWLRRRYSKSKAISQQGESNSQYGSRWIYNKEIKKSKKIPKTDALPTGWQEGRIINWNKEEEYDQCPVCLKNKNVRQKFCSCSCSTTYWSSKRGNKKLNNKVIESILISYQQGDSIHKCLKDRNLCGTGTNFTKIKKEIENRGIA